MSCREQPNLFVDVGTIDGLYRGAPRLEQRVGALLGAKVSGRDPIDMAIDWLAWPDACKRTVLDLGCGLGRATRKLAARLRPRMLIAFDRSAAMLAATRNRVPEAAIVRGDFHRLPFAGCSLDLVLAAFCLYHSPTPDAVCRGIARCLSATGVAVLVTKGRDSYREIDGLLASASLDPYAPMRPSLYSSFCAETAREIVPAALRIETVLCERHAFHFGKPEDLVAYVRTSPKYSLPDLGRNNELMCTALARVWPSGGLVTTSDIAVLFAVRADD